MVNKIEICAVKIPKNGSLSLFDVLLQSISVEKRDKILKFYRIEDAMRSLFADLLLRTMLCKYGNFKNSDLFFVYNSYGKPYLANNNRIEFNVSHSGDWVVCVVYHSQIGIDIEEIKEKEYLKLSKRFFSTKEVQDLMIKPKEKQLQYFYNLWTLKESYVKNIGCGLSMSLSSFTITQTNGNYYLVNTPKDKIANYKFQQYLIDDNYICSVCVKGGLQLMPSKVQIFNSQILITEFMKYNY